MYDILKLTLQSGNFKYSEIQPRIKRLYAMGDLSTDQLEELLSLAAEQASPDAERPELLILVQNLYAKIAVLEARVTALSQAQTSSETASSSQYPTWAPWDGLSSNYQFGAIVEHNGQFWQSTYSGQNVWEPGTVDARFWTKYTSA